MRQLCLMLKPVRTSSVRQYSVTKALLNYVQFILPHNKHITRAPLKEMFACTLQFNGIRDVIITMKHKIDLNQKINQLVSPSSDNQSNN